MQQPSRAAFTMIELMIVLVVIATLAGLILAGIGIVQRRSKEVETTARIANLGSAIAKYETQTGALPEAGTDPVGGDAAMQSDMNGDELDLAEAGANNARLTQTIALVDGDNFGRNSKAVDHRPIVDESGRTIYTGTVIIDAWGQPLIYRPYMLYPLIDGHPVPVHSADPPRPDSYQIWSLGENRRNENGERAGQADDIANW